MHRHTSHLSRGTFLLLAMLLLSATACGAETQTLSSRPLAPPAATAPAINPPAPDTTTGGAPAPAAARAPASGLVVEPKAALRPGGAAPTGGPEMPPLAAATDTPAAAEAAPTAEVAGAIGAPAAGAAPGAPLHYGNPAPAYQSPLTAGQVDDNAKFPAYLDFIQSYQGPPIRPIDVAQRLFVRVVDGTQRPVAGARVQLFAGDRPVFDGRTVSDGRVLFFPAAAGAGQAPRFRAVITRGQQQATATLDAGTPETTVSLAHLADNSGPVGVDLVFLLDATGSMGDEIDTVKATIDSIAARVEQLPGSSRPRLGLVAFRDRGDDFVTRSWDFTDDVSQFAGNLAAVSAGGGGDNPESVNAGLHDAIHLPGWAPVESGRHVRMIVLVGDAPPHLDYPNDYDYPTLLGEAVQAGIKVFPVGASGLDDQGEYIFRQFAEVTQGQFVFMTYANGESGAPGPATDHHVSDFTVSHLDNLVVRLVAGEVANQTGSAVQTGSLPPAPAGLVGGAAPAAPLAPPAAAAAPDLLERAGTVFGRLPGEGAPLWALLGLLGGLWLWRAPRREARARRQAVSFAAPAASAPAASPPRARVRGDEPVTLAALTLPPAAGSPAGALTWSTGGHPTAPLPAREA